jgi:adenosylhomocysteine nucleosidase
MSKRIIGIMGAMPEEIDGVVHLLSDVAETTLGNRMYYSGKLNGIEVVVVFSRWGKVAAATTVSTLINVFGITELIFSGVAGAIHHELNIGDVVIGKRMFQHDMDARPLIAQYEIPLLSRTFFEGDAQLSSSAADAVNTFLQKENITQAIGADTLAQFNINQPKLYTGDIASGDKFFSSNEHKEALSNSLPTVLCVEMEGAAVAQVCFEYNIPCCIIRTISDAADEQSHIDFVSFIQHVSSKYSVEIIRNMLG